MGLRVLDFRPNGGTKTAKREARDSSQRYGGRVEAGARERHLKTALSASETGKEPQAKHLWAWRSRERMKMEPPISCQKKAVLAMFLF